MWVLNNSGPPAARLTRCSARTARARAANCEHGYGSKGNDWPTCTHSFPTRASREEVPPPPDLVARFSV